MNKKSKYYVVFAGHVPGVYKTIEECTKQTKGFSNSRFKAFNTEGAANKAFEDIFRGGNSKSLNGTKQQIPNVQNTNKQFRFGIPLHWEHFITCILLHLLIPLIPLILELIFTSSLSTKSLTLIAAVYSITIGKSTSSSAQFAISIIISLIFSACYGITVASQKALEMINTGAENNNQPINYMTEIQYLDVISGLAILMIFILHIMERYNKHIVDRIPFLELKR